MLIDVFHDTACPWCRIGQKNLFDALGQWKKEPVNIRWHPFFLDSSIPPEGCDFHSFMQQRKKLTTVQLQQMFNHVRLMGEAVGVQFNFDKIRSAVNTRLSHQLIAIASTDLRNNIVEAIYQAYFEYGLNIGDVEVLVNVGKSYQMNENYLRQCLTDTYNIHMVITEAKKAHLQGINSVPCFIFNNQIMVNGSQSVNVLLRALNRSAFIEVLAKQW